MTVYHAPIILSDGTIQCSCGSTVQHWYPSHDWDTALVCHDSGTPIANRGYAARLYAQATELVGTL